ncbi:MAG: hypothetical protein WA667_24990 [Candidatus Nitrosopolaris sp.]
MTTKLLLSHDIESKIIDNYISKLQSCENLPTSTLRAIYDKLINLIFDASSKKISDSLKDYKPFVTNSTEKENNKEIDAKRITKEKIRKIITEVIKQEHDVPLITEPYLSMPESNSKIMLQEISKEEVELYTKKIIIGTNSAAKRSTFKQLELLANTKRLWMHDCIWDVIDRGIRTEVPKENLISAVYLLKRMLKESKEKSDGHDKVVNETKQLLMNKFIEIISSTNQIWYEYKDEAKLILQYITNDAELFLILWHGWKKCVYISDRSQFYSSISAFLNNLLNFLGSTLQSTKIVEKERYELVESPIDYVASRAEALHS